MTASIYPKAIPHTYSQLKVCFKVLNELGRIELSINSLVTSYLHFKINIYSYAVRIMMKKTSIFSRGVSDLAAMILSCSFSIPNPSSISSSIMAVLFL